MIRYVRSESLQTQVKDRYQITFPKNNILKAIFISIFFGTKISS